MWGASLQVWERPCVDGSVHTLSGHAPIVQASYETSNKELEAFKKEAKPKMKLLRSAMPAKAADAGKDEV